MAASDPSPHIPTGIPATCSGSSPRLKTPRPKTNFDRVFGCVSHRNTCELVLRSTPRAMEFRAMEFRGGSRPDGGPSHRRLVRPRTSPDDHPSFGPARPSPPPFPHRGHAPSAGWSRGGAADHPRHTTEKVYDSSSRHDLLCDNFDAHQLECLRSEGGQGWNAEVEDAQVTDSSNGIVAEGLPSSCRSKPDVQPPSSSRRGRSCLTRRSATTVISRGVRTRHRAGGRSAHRQPPKRPRWNARFWVRARELPAVRRGERGVDFIQMKPREAYHRKYCIEKHV